MALRDRTRGSSRSGAGAGTSGPDRLGADRRLEGAWPELRHRTEEALTCGRFAARVNQWYLTQLASATPPTDSSAIHGHDVFVQRTCIMCHTIAGTPAGSGVGPDLTHIATRPSLAAGVLPNTRENLGRWILNPQLIKPGVKMPPNPLSPADMNGLLDYLETLK